MTTRFPPPPNTSDVNEPLWRDWFYKISVALNSAYGITTNPLIAGMAQGTFPMSGMMGEVMEGDSEEILFGPPEVSSSGGGGGTDLSYTASTRLLASSTGTDVTLPLVTGTEAGLAPLSGGGTANFLRADGTWAAPAGGSGLAQYQVRQLIRR